MTTTDNKTLVTGFIEDIWNRQRFDRIGQYVHDDYEDHSFLPGMPTGVDGLRAWIAGTGKAFVHRTEIEHIVAEGDYVAIHVMMHLKHVGTWRKIAATGREVSVKGFRFYRVKDGRLIAHHGMIDGESIQNALTEEYHGCELPVKSDAAQQSER